MVVSEFACEAKLHEICKPDNLVICRITLHYHFNDLIYLTYSDPLTATDKISLIIRFGKATLFSKCFPALLYMYSMIAFPGTIIVTS